MDSYHGYVLIINIFAFGLFSLCTVSLRIGHRSYIKRITSSDWFLVAAFLSSVIQHVFLSICVMKYGYGHHVYDVSETVRNSDIPLKLLTSFQTLFELTTMCTKVSICLAYWDLLKRGETNLFKWTRVANWFIATVILGYYVASAFVNIFQCTPFPKAWHPEIPGFCVNLSAVGYTNAGVDIITSVVLMVLPLPLLSTLTRNRKEVYQIMGLILLGLVHIGVRIGRLLVQRYPDAGSAADPQWFMIKPLSLAIVEMDIGVVTAALILMRPCFVAVFGFFSGLVAALRPRRTPPVYEIELRDR